MSALRVNSGTADGFTKRKAARGQLFDSELMIVDQALDNNRLGLPTIRHNVNASEARQQLTLCQSATLHANVER